MGWVWREDGDDHDESSDSFQDIKVDFHSTRKVVQSNCRTEEVEPGKFVRKCEKTEEVLRDCLGNKQSMADVGETSSAPSSSATERPLVVRVKRKPSQSPLGAFWLEISERPLKRALIDFEKLSLSGSSVKEESRTRRVFVKHVETVNNSEDTIDVLQSFVFSSDNGSRSQANNRGKHSVRKDSKQVQLVSKAKQEQEALAKSARFEQIWRSRRGSKEAVDEELDGVCRLYDVVRVDAEDTSEKAKKEEPMSKEDQDALSKFLPMLKDLVPDAAEDIESEINSYDVSEQDAQDEFMYDLYTIGDITEDADDSHPFPLVQVNDDDEWYDGPDDIEYESDSNDENNPMNDYPEEESVESETSTEDDESEEDEEEEKEESGSEESTSNVDSKNLDGSDYDDMDINYLDDDTDASRHASSDDDDVDAEDRWVYR